jgi:hypothetical protein
MPFFAPTQEEERSFLSVLRHTVLEGPLRLVRFTDSSRGHKAAYGRKDPKTGLYAPCRNIQGDKRPIAIQAARFNWYCVLMRKRVGGSRVR